MRLECACLLQKGGLGDGLGLSLGTAYYWQLASDTLFDPT